MKRIGAWIVVGLMLVAGMAFGADQRIQYNERMVGAGHPTLSDTLNRLSQIEHNTDGTHKTLSGNVHFIGKYTGIADALTQLGSTQATLVVNADTTVSTAVTIPSTLSVAVTNGGKFTKSGSGTVTINGPFEAGLYQVFSGFAAGDVTGLLVSYPEWFGATGDDSTDSTTAIASAISSLRAGGGTVFFSPGAYRFTSIDLTGKTGITLQGLGGLYDTSLRWTPTTGNLINLTNATYINFNLLNFLPSAQKTAGALFYLNNSANITFNTLRISSAYIGFDITNGSSDIRFKNIRCLDYSTSHTWSAAMLVGQIAQVSQIYLDDFWFQSQTNLIDSAFHIIDVDTFVAYNSGAQKQVTAQFTGWYIQGGDFIHLTDCFSEVGSTTAAGYYISGGTNIQLLNCHSSSNLYGLHIAGGNGIQVIGGLYYFNARNGIFLAGGSNITIDGPHLMDNSTITDNTWDAFFVNAGVSNWNANITVGSVRGTPEIHRYAAYISAGASDNYVLTGRLENFGTGAFYDAGTGRNKRIDVIAAGINSIDRMPSAVTTTDATVTTLWSLGLSDETKYKIKAEVSAQQLDGSNRADYERAVTVYRDGGGVATIQGSVADLYTSESNAALDCTFDTSTNQVRLRVTGIAATTFKWRGRVKVDSQLAGVD